MIPNQRKKGIFEHLQKEKFSSISELSNLFNVSEVTIHRDLKELEKARYISKVHGGAILVENDKAEARMNVRLKRNMEEKREIAEKSIRLIDDDTSIFLDQSSTCFYLAKELSKRNFQHLVVVTNSVSILAELEENINIDVISTGGALQHEWSALTGPHALECISKINFDQIFISCRGISIEQGLMTSFLFVSEILKKASEVTRQINLLADSSKFSKVGTFSIMPVSVVNRIITDKKLYPGLAKRYRDLGIELFI
jgi:DeoR/GlpR family transcriptional regulator of sugar metabolism